MLRTESHRLTRASEDRRRAVVHAPFALSGMEQACEVFENAGLRKHEKLRVRPGAFRCAYVLLPQRK